MTETRYVPRPDAEPIPVGGPNTSLRLPGSLIVNDHPREGLTVEIALRWDASALTVGSVVVQARAGREVSTNDLRSVRVVETIREHLPQNVESTAAIDDVAQTYNLARALRLHPIKAVMETFGVSRATAHRWVDRLRDRGEIIDTPKDGA